MTDLIINYITDGYISFTSMDEKSKYLTITEFIKLKTLNPRRRKNIFPMLTAESLKEELIVASHLKELSTKEEKSA